jgi:hypothetical protein
MKQATCRVETPTTIEAFETACRQNATSTIESVAPPRLPAPIPAIKRAPF